MLKRNVNFTTGECIIEDEHGVRKMTDEEVREFALEFTTNAPFPPKNDSDYEEVDE